MKFYKFALWKAYFEKGYSITSYIKYLFAIIGIAGLKGVILIPAFLLYGISCFFIGKIIYKSGFADAENEVGNQFNPFAKQVRHKLDINRLP